jgi:amidase
MTDIAFRPAGELTAAIRSREISSRELLDHLLERVERLDPPINAVISLDVERARDRADQADAALARGESWGPLHGLPITVKDCFETAGLRTSCGAPQLADHVPERNAVAVARLLAAGAVLFGKTNTPTFAMDWQTYNPLHGTTRNPWNTDRTPGGSSGGSAAAVAAGLTGLELGSDIGGSIRIPAHCCGVYGHKPSWGIVPERGHIPGLPGSLIEDDINVVGPLARDASDLDLALAVIAGETRCATIASRSGSTSPPRRSTARCASSWRPPSRRWSRPVCASTSAAVHRSSWHTRWISTNACWPRSPPPP